MKRNYFILEVKSFFISNGVEYLSSVTYNKYENTLFGSKSAALEALSDVVAEVQKNNNISFILGNNKKNNNQVKMSCSETQYGYEIVFVQEEYPSGANNQRFVFGIKKMVLKK